MAAKALGIDLVLQGDTFVMVSLQTVSLNFCKIVP